MIHFNPKLEFNMAKKENQINRALSLAQFALDNQIIMDTSPFVPYRMGDLDKSSTKASDIGGGLIVYDTPYAKKWYYNTPKYGFSKKTHPLAQSFWFEASKAAYGDKWEQLAQRTVDKNV